MKRSGTVGAIVSLIAAAVLVRAQAARRQPGQSIGAVSTLGNRIVVTLNEGALGQANLFDLAGRTVRFTPDGAGYRAETGALQWDSDFGPEVTAGRVMLKNFVFPLSGRKWDSLSVGRTGTIGFGETPAVSIGRFDPLSLGARNLVRQAPAICVFFKPRMTGQQFVKELPDRVVVTWSLTEPFGNIQDFTWTPTVNQFQAVLGKDGSVEMRYRQMAAKDGIVGIYPATGGAAAERHLSAIRKDEGPFPGLYEAFHYLALPNMQDLSCTVIQALGDRFDLLAFYSDFRIDNQEAGTPSNGPLGGGPAGDAVTGIRTEPQDLASYCTQGRFQWEYIQPVYAGSNQMQEYPPDGLTDTRPRNVQTYTHQLAERTANGRIPPYDYAMSQLGHEMGHRWSAFVSAKVGNETIRLADGAHWVAGLQAPAVFPYQRPTEASAMGGGVWQDNFDGTFTQLDDDYYVPATGWSHLDLYLMGLIAPSEVPDFFILRNLVRVGTDGGGHAIFKADRTKLTIRDVIAAEGPRLPDVDHAQKKFNIGIVVMVEHGKKPSAELLDRTEGIRKAWIDYWETTTGHRSSMTAEVR